MDATDRKILKHLQQDCSLTVGELSERIGMSSTPVWNRIKRLEEQGIIAGRVALVDPAKVGLGLAGFVLVRTSNHSEDWLNRFAQIVAEIPEIIEVHRMAGDIDYILKLVAPDVAGYDAIYKRLVSKIELSDVSASFSMEVVKSTTALPLAEAM